MKKLLRLLHHYCSKLGTRLSTALKNFAHTPHTIAPYPPSLHLHQDMIDALNHGVMLIDIHRVIRAVNTKSSALWGTSKEALKGKDLSSLFLQTEASSLDFMWGLRNNAIEPIKLQATNQEGMVFFIEATLRPVYIGREAYYILNITDLSLQVEAETALGVKQNELELVIYKVAHELQGPLSSIFGLIQLMQSPTLDCTQILYYLDMVEKSAQKLESTLREIIMFNDIYAHQIRQERFTALDIFQETIENVIHTPTCENVFFNIPMHEDLELVSDSKLIRNIVQDLVLNAIHFRSQQHFAYVKLNIHKCKSFFEIEVSDNGEGIPDTIKPMIFDMFYRGSKRSKGSGLGLYLVKKSVEKLKGNIQVVSMPGLGSTFTVRIPSVA